MSITWNPNDMGPGFVLSNSNLTASKNGTFHSTLRANYSRSNEKYYFEIFIDNAVQYEYNGVATIDASLNNYCGSDNYGWGFNPAAVIYHNGSTFDTDIGYSSGSTIQIAVDGINGFLWFGADGTWVNNGDPSTGNNPTFTDIQFTGNIFPAGSVFNDGGVITLVPYNFTYSIPDGFKAFGYRGYFDGYVYEQGSPVSRTLFLHRRDTGALVATTTSSGNGYYYLETSISGSHYIVCLDNSAGEDYNDLIIGNVYPTTISG